MLPSLLHDANKARTFASRVFLMAPGLVLWRPEAFFYCTWHVRRNQSNISKWFSMLLHDARGTKHPMHFHWRLATRVLPQPQEPCLSEVGDVSQGRSLSTLLHLRVGRFTTQHARRTFDNSFSLAGHVLKSTLSARQMHRSQNHDPVLRLVWPLKEQDKGERGFPEFPMEVLKLYTKHFESAWGLLTHTHTPTDGKPIQWPSLQGLQTFNTPAPSNRLGDTKIKQGHTINILLRTFKNIFFENNWQVMLVWPFFGLGFALRRSRPDKGSCALRAKCFHGLRPGISWYIGEHTRE